MRLLKLVPQGTRIDFLAARRVAVGATVLSFVASVILLLTVGLNLGIDFRGGSMMIAQTPAKVPVAEWRAALSGLGIGEIAVTEISDAAGAAGEARHQVSIRIVDQGPAEGIQDEAIAKVKAAVTQRLPGAVFLSTESVGGKVSAELIRAGVLAVVLAVLGVCIYVWARFEWQFAVGAVIGLVHDVVLTLGLFSLLGLDFNLSIIAALLTIVGYSLNDTVIVFDRIRENLRKYRRMPLAELINLSTNETLSRTLMTSGTTLIALVALYVFGGEVIRGFTFAMIWGVLIGTYSSIYVAGVIVNWLGVPRGDKPSSKAGTQFANIDA